MVDLPDTARRTDIDLRVRLERYDCGTLESLNEFIGWSPDQEADFRDLRIEDVLARRKAITKLPLPARSAAAFRYFKQLNTLSVAEAAKRLGLYPKALQNRIAYRSIPHYYLVDGKQPRIPLAFVEEGAAAVYSRSQ